MNHPIPLSPRIIVCPNDIVQVQGESNYSRIFFSDGQNIVITQNLGMIEQKLPSDFVRIHKSHLVNVRYVSGILRRQKAVMLINGCRIPVARRRKAMVLMGALTVTNVSFGKPPVLLQPALEFNKVF